MIRDDDLMVFSWIHEIVCGFSTLSISVLLKKAPWLHVLWPPFSKIPDVFRRFSCSVLHDNDELFKLIRNDSESCRNLVRFAIFSRKSPRWFRLTLDVLCDISPLN